MVVKQNLVTEICGCKLQVALNWFPKPNLPFTHVLRIFRHPAVVYNNFHSALK